jgi:hypothetical protein
LLDIAKSEIFAAYYELAVNGKEKPKKTATKQRKATLDSLTEMIYSWSYISSNPTRNELVYRLTKYLNENDLKAKTGCIPSVLVQGKYPIELVRYHCDKDVCELLGRMVWINDQYECCIGILAGLDDPQVGEELEETYGRIFAEEDGVVLILV